MVSKHKLQRPFKKVIVEEVEETDSDADVAMVQEDSETQLEHSDSDDGDELVEDEQSQKEDGDDMVEEEEEESEEGDDLVEEEESENEEGDDLVEEEESENEEGDDLVEEESENEDAMVKSAEIEAEEPSGNGEDSGDEGAAASDLKDDNKNTKKGENTRIVFDEDEDFENLPIPESLAQDQQDLDGKLEESDSDAAPDEVTLSAGKDITKRDDSKIEVEAKRKKQLIKRQRRRKHEKNKDQKEEKRQKLEVQAKRKKFPEELLAAVAAEQKAKQTASIKKSEGRLTTFVTEDSSDPINDIDNTADTDDVISFEQGVQVRTLLQETKKNKSITEAAADFRQRALYGSRINRMPTKNLQVIRTKQEKSGKQGHVKRTI